MVSRSMTSVLIFAFALHAVFTAPGVASASPSAHSAPEVSSVSPPAEVAESSTDLARGTELPLVEEPATDNTLRDEERLALSSSTYEDAISLSFSDSDAWQERLGMFRLTVEFSVDEWHNSSVHPAGIAGWLTGRKNEWNVPGHSDEEVLADMFNDLGNTLPAGITAGLLLSDSSSAKEAGRAARDAIGLTAAATHLLKSTIDSPRPANPDLLDGFPSGHTSVSVAFARAIDKHHSGWGTAAYLWAGGVGWSRVRRGDHTMEQVLAGALLGWAVADAVSDGPDRPRVSTPRGGGPMIPAGRASW